MSGGGENHRGSVGDVEAGCCGEPAVANAVGDDAAVARGIEVLLQQQADDLAFSELVVSPSGVSVAFRGHIHRAFTASTLLVERARAAGVLRPDFDHSDLYLLIQANAGLVKATRRSAPDAWKQLGKYMLQAFRQPSDEELPPVSAAWNRLQHIND